MTDRDIDDDWVDPLVEETHEAIEHASTPVSPTRRIFKITLRVVFVVGALALSFWVLARTFDDLDVDEIVDTVQSLDDADTMALAAMWLLWIGSQGLLTASLIPGLPVRRGVVAYLGPAGVTSIVPGPSDLPFRYRMLTSWGNTPADATLAVAAGGIFSIGIKLVLPVIAAVGLVVSGTPITGTLLTVVVLALIVGAGVVVFGFVFGSATRTEQAGRLIAPLWHLALRRLGKPEPDDLPTQMVASRAHAMDTLHDRWIVATWATVLTAATKFALLVMVLRFSGVDESALPWPQVFVVFALVQGLTVIPITAGDAGVSEIAYIGMLTAAAGQGYVNQITAAVLIFRVLTWLLIIPVGLGTLGVWHLQWRRRRRSDPQPATSN
jgi:hypothetical protein